MLDLQSPRGQILVEKVIQVALAIGSTKLDSKEAASLWAARWAVRDRWPEALKLVLRACDWTKPADVAEVHQLLLEWPLLEPGVRCPLAQG